MAQEEISNIAGQKAIQTISTKDISNFKLRKGMPIGVKVTLRREKMYEFMERLINVALPRIRDFNGINSKFDGKGNYSLGIPNRSFSRKSISTRSARSWDLRLHL